MAEEDLLLELWERNIYPNCGRQIPGRNANREWAKKQG